jgi:preprotein translocase subunit SecG
LQSISGGLYTFYVIAARPGALQVLKDALEVDFKSPLAHHFYSYSCRDLEMITLITIVHIIVCLFLIIVVLLQSGKSGDIAAAFGGMGSQTAFGPRGAATALSKATTWSAIIFMVTSLTLSIFATRRGGPKSVLQGVNSSETKSQPAPPSQKPAPPQQK